MPISKEVESSRRETDTKTDTNFPTLGEFGVIGTNPPTTRYSAEPFPAIVVFAHTTMKARFRTTRRGSRGGALYCVDTQTGKRTSLGTAGPKVARRVVQAKNKAEQQPALN